MAGKAGKIVDQLCDIISSSPLSDYNSDDEISSRSSAAPYSSSSTIETAQSKTVEDSSKNSTTSIDSKPFLSGQHLLICVGKVCPKQSTKRKEM